MIGCHYEQGVGVFIFRIIVSLTRARTLNYMRVRVLMSVFDCFATLMYQNPNTDKKPPKIFGQFTKKQYLCTRFRAQRKRATNGSEIH